MGSGNNWPRMDKMSAQDLKIVGGTNPGRYEKISIESTYNMVVSGRALVPYSGYKSLVGIGDDPNAIPRGLFVSQLGNFMIAVIGNSVYKIDTTLSSVHLGDVSSSGASVDIAENGNSEIAISDGSEYFVYNYSKNTFLKEDIGIKTSSIDSALGFIFATVPSSNTFSYSAVNDATTAFPNTNQGEIGSDKVVCVRAFQERIYVFGQRHTKIWRDLGLALNPFQLDQSIIIESGCINKDSVAIGFGMMAWVSKSEDGSAEILASTGGYPTPISTDGIDFKLSKLTSPENCSGFIFQEDGHVFYQITFYDDGITLVYDFTTKMFLYATDEKLSNHIAKKVVNFNGTYYFISFSNATLYSMSSQITTYDGSIIPRIRITPPLKTIANDYFRISYLQMVAEQGMNEDPMYVDISFSVDGGVSFSSAKRIEFSNFSNNFKVMQMFRLGAARDWSFQFRFYGKGRPVITRAYVEVKDEDISAPFE